jgi:hypothetical protein
MCAQIDSISTQALENNLVDYPDIKYGNEYNLPWDISDLNQAEIDNANSKMIFTAGPKSNTWNGNPQKRRMLFPAENFRPAKEIKLLDEQVDNEQRTLLPNSGTLAAKLKEKVRIRRPPNAFIVFANEWRKKIAAQNPQERNKQISTRLGAMWKLLSKEEKERYTDMARKLDEEHKEKYPEYVYCPKEARLKKALRAEARDLKITNTKCRKMNTALKGTSSRHKVSKEQEVDIKMLYRSYCPEIVATESCTHSNSLVTRMLPEQEAGLQETTKVFQGQVRQNMFQEWTDKHLNVGSSLHQQSARDKKVPRNRKLVVIRKVDGQRFLPHVQKPQSGTIYITVSNDDIKIVDGNVIALHVTEEHQQQIQSHPLKMQQVNRSYGRCMQIQQIAGTQGNSEPNAAGHIITHNDRDAGSRGDDTASSVEQHHDLRKHLGHDQLLSLKSITTEETQGITPMSLESHGNHLPQHLLEDYADFIDKCLLQSDLNNEILAFKAALELDKF